MNYRQVYEVVKKLLGEIQPVGETTQDNKRQENLIETFYLVKEFVDDILLAASNRERSEHSMKEIGKSATKMLEELKQMIEDDLYTKE